MSKIYRYPQVGGFSTKLNPLEDLAILIDGLRSAGYTSDIMRERHGIHDSNVIRSATKSIKNYAENANGLIEQAQAGPTRLSFLPLYYAILNLSKVCICISGKEDRLSGDNLFHGAIYKAQRDLPRNFLNDTITIKPDGVLPVLYEVLTKSSWPYLERRGTPIKVGSLYPYIPGISFEYSHITNRKQKIAQCDLKIKSASAKVDEKFLSLEFHDNADGPKPTSIRRNQIPLIARIECQRNQIDGSNCISFTGEQKFSSYEEAKCEFRSLVQTSLLYERDEEFIFTPVVSPNSQDELIFASSQFQLLTEELPIWLTFFHMSSVVRYRPDYLAKLIDSKYWPMVQTLSRHGLLTYLNLTLNFCHQTSFFIHS